MSEIDKEISEIKFMLEKIDGTIDSRLIGIETPDEDEIDEIKAYQEKKNSGIIELNGI